MADILIYGPLRSMAGDGKAAFASQIYDEDLGMFQSEINQQGGGGGGGSNPSGLFIAEYGVTPYADIRAALNAGKIPVINYDGRLYVFSYDNVSGDTGNLCFNSSLNRNYFIRVSTASAYFASSYIFEETSNKTNDISSNKTSTTKYPTTKGVADYLNEELENVEDVLDAILGSDTLHEQKKMDIVSASGTSLSAAVNTYYNFASEVNTLAVTLPSVTDSIHINNIVFMLTTGSAPAVTFAAPSGINVIAQDGFSIEASTTYEINAIFNGIAWVVAAMKLSTTPINS